MWKLSDKSEHELSTCSFGIQRWVRVLQEHSPCDFTIIKGWRSDTEQAEDFASGASQARPGESPHNVVGFDSGKPKSLAVDMVPFYKEVPGGIDWRSDKELLAAIRRGDEREAVEILEVIRRRMHFVGYALGLASAMGTPMINGADWDGDGRFNEHHLIDSPHYQERDWKKTAGVY